jgi:hypothetical protein
MPKIMPPTFFKVVYDEIDSRLDVAAHARRRSEIARHEDALAKAKEEFLFIGSGFFREVFDIGNGLVMKIAKPWALGLQDEDCNKVEAQAYEQLGTPFAECVMSEYEGVPVLLMVKVSNTGSRRLTHEFRDLPNWAKHLDAAQVGQLDDGTWVAYDYGFWNEAEEAKRCYEQQNPTCWCRSPISVPL